MLDLATLSDDACDALIRIFLKAKPASSVHLVDVSAPEPPLDPAQGRFRGTVKSWWPEKGYGFLECDTTFAHYQCDIYINRLAIGLFQKSDDVIFSVELNKEGKPQGKNLLPVEPEAKRRQLLAACDPEFDLDSYLKEHKLGPYALALNDNQRSNRNNKGGPGQPFNNDPNNPNNDPFMIPQTGPDGQTMWVPAPPGTGGPVPPPGQGPGPGGQCNKGHGGPGPPGNTNGGSQSGSGKGSSYGGWSGKGYNGNSNKGTMGPYGMEYGGKGGNFGKDSWKGGSQKGKF